MAQQQCSTALEWQLALNVDVPSKALRLAKAPCRAQHDYKAGRVRGLALLNTNHLLS